MPVPGVRPILGAVDSSIRSLISVEALEVNVSQLRSNIMSGTNITERMDWLPAGSRCRCIRCLVWILTPYVALYDTLLPVHVINVLMIEYSRSEWSDTRKIRRSENPQEIASSDIYAPDESLREILPR